MNAWFLPEFASIIGFAYFMAVSRGHKGLWCWVYRITAILCALLAISIIVAEAYH